jgi:hypothetical protein
MIKNLIHNTNPIIFHAQGKIKFCPLWEKIKDSCFSPKKIPNELAIVTFNNGNSFGGKENGCFEKSIENQCVAMGKEIANWKNSLKIQLTIEFLEKTKSDYILSADSSDVVVYSFNNIIESFENKKCQMLYNAELYCYPNRNNSEIEKSKFEKPFYHLNAGVWIGKREFALDFYKELLIAVNEETISDQGCIREIYLRYYPKILIDDKCSIFQTLNGVNEKILSV